MWVCSLCILILTVVSIPKCSVAAIMFVILTKKVRVAEKVSLCGGADNQQ